MRYFLLFLTAAWVTCSHAQDQSEAIKATVNKLFSAMKNADAAGVRDVFAPGAILQSVAKSKEGVKVETYTITAFAETIATLGKGDADEQIVFETIRVDGDLAMVWAPYKFYYKGKFSHCGADSFQLVRIGGEWKIQYLIDTRRRDCEE